MERRYPTTFPDKAISTVNVTHLQRPHTASNPRNPDFTVCSKGCRKNFCSGDETRYTGDYALDAIPDPTTQCIILHPGPPNILTQRVRFEADGADYCIPLVDDSRHFATCRYRKVQNDGTELCWIKNLNDSKPTYLSIRVDDSASPYAVGELRKC